jgi:protein SCO1/2
LFYDDLVRGKTVVFSFFYTRCEGICPAATANLVKVQALLGERLGREIFMYSISLKPREDTPRALTDYAAEYGIRPGWTLLTGQPADCELLRRKLGFVDPDPRVDADTSQHVGVIVYGSEPLDRWSACPAVSEPGEIVKYISWVEE